MSDAVAVKPNGKILFGVDYYSLIQFTQFPDENEKYDVKKELVVDAIAKLFLLQWDFTLDDIDETCKLYWEKSKAGTLEDNITPAIDRVVDFLKGDKKNQEKLLIEIAAVSQMDDTFIKREGYMRDWLQSKLDFRPSEMEDFYKKGWNWSRALNFVGDKYIEMDKMKKE